MRKFEPLNRGLVYQVQVLIVELGTFEQGIGVPGTNIKYYLSSTVELPTL